MISWFPNNEIQDMHDRKRHDDQDLLSSKYYLKPLFSFYFEPFFFYCNEECIFINWFQKTGAKLIYYIEAAP